VVYAALSCVPTVSKRAVEWHEEKGCKELENKRRIVLVLYAQKQETNVLLVPQTQPHTKAPF